MRLANVLLQGEHVEEALAAGEYVMHHLELLLIANISHLEGIITDSLLDDEPVEPGEGGLDSTIDEALGLIVVYPHDLLQHIRLELIFLLMSLQVDGMLHRRLIVLIQPD